MNIFQKIKSSIYDPAYYREIPNQNFSYSIKYFFSLALILAFISSVIFSIIIIPKITPFFNSLGDEFLSYYPEELILTIKDGQASTNLRDKEPYSVKFPEEIKNQASNPQAYAENLLVIDTKSQFTIDGFKNYKTAYLVSHDSLAYRGRNGEITIQPLTRFPNMTISKANVTFFIEKIRPYLKILYFVLPILLFGFFTFIMALNLFYLLLASLLIWLFLKSRKAAIGYKKSYQLSLHVITLPMIVQALLVWLSITIGIPFLFTIVMIVMVLLNLMDFKGKASSA